MTTRRAFIAVLGGVAAWPLAARAQQQGERVRRIGVLLSSTADDPKYQDRLTAFLQGLAQLGWIAGRNIRIDIRWGSFDAERARKHVAEIVELAPDVILSSGSSTTALLYQATRTIPIVFATLLDPVGAGLVESMARPGGNITGFATLDYEMSGKWLELLKEIAPGVTRAAVIRDPGTAAGVGQFAAIQAGASSQHVNLTPINLRAAADLERAVAAFARTRGGGLIVTQSAPASVHRALIVKLAARYELPAVYSARPFITAGGLIAYGPDRLDLYRQAADYVDRILKGEKPADLPVRRRPNSSSSSTSRLPRRSTSTSRRPCSPAPTRS